MFSTRVLGRYEVGSAFTDQVELINVDTIDLNEVAQVPGSGWGGDAKFDVYFIHLRSNTGGLVNDPQNTLSVNVCNRSDVDAWLGIGAYFVSNSGQKLQFGYHETDWLVKDQCEAFAIGTNGEFISFSLDKLKKGEFRFKFMQEDYETVIFDKAKLVTEAQP